MMTYPLTSQEYQDVLQLSAEQRHKHFINKVVKWNEIWSLSSDEGWVSLIADGDDCFPVWPHPDYAAAWATNDWSDCKPKVISLQVWLERWITGMKSDGSMIVIFPDLNDEGIVVSPDEIKASLLEALALLKNQ